MCVCVCVGGEGGRRGTVKLLTLRGWERNQIQDILRRTGRGKGQGYKTRRRVSGGSRNNSSYKCVTLSVNLIHIAINFQQNIQYGYLVMVCTRTP